MLPTPFPFPFSALTGQPQLTQALLLAAIDPAIGGVLIEGPRGTAKSTAARALAALMAPAPFVTVPLGAALEHVTGTLDLNEALAGHAVRLAPGLLARAHGGVLYVDEINLLPDALVDVLLDAAASGVNVIERDGISHTHAARFVLIGTMNPEEGELRPQLLDRLGLCVRLANVDEPQTRQAIVKARLAFDANPAAFAAQHADAQAALAARLAHARAAAHDAAALPLSDAVHDAASRLCIAAHVDGLRADLVMLRAARALAAWGEAPVVTPAHVAQVADMVLTHRRNADTASSPSPSPHSPPSPADSNTAAHTSSVPQSPLKSGEKTGRDSGQHSSNDRSADAGNAPGDWGALPPEPVGIAAVKPLKPLYPRTPPKKP
ncbi:MAG: ATP-binding protein [Pseudomonadota bacterium]|nr:ATP-binding protein [Pseudomonadota bacterium]